MARPTTIFMAIGLMAALAACERQVILSGQRFDTRVPLAETEPAAAGALVAEQLPQNRSLPIRLPAAVANAEWGHRGGNPAHAAPHGALSAQPQRIWSATIGTGNSRRNRIAAAPVVSAGLVYTMDAQNEVVATSAANGGTAWRASAVPPGESAQSASGGGLAVGEGTLFVTTGFGELVAMDPATGAVRWRQRFEAPISGAPVVSGGLVFVSARDSVGWAVSARDGRQSWVLSGVPSVSGVSGGGAPAVDGRLAVFPFGSGQVMAADRASGDIAWMSAVAGQRRGRAVAFVSDIAADPVIVGGTVFVGSASGRIAALRLADGQRLWEEGEGAMGAPLVVGGSVFAITDENRLVRLSASDGETVWAVPLGLFVRENPRRQARVTAHYGPVLAGGRLVVVSSDGEVRFFSPESGASLGSATFAGGAAAPPALAGGVLYVVGTNGYLHAFR